MARIEQIIKEINGVETEIYPVTIHQSVVDESNNETLDVTLGKKATHGYNEGETPKTLKQVDDDKAAHGYTGAETVKTLKEVETLKASHGYESNPKTLKEVEDDTINTTEKPTAQSLSELNARITALEAILSNKIKDRIDVTKEFNVWGKTNLILYGDGASTKTPDFIGQTYIDTTNGNVYIAVGTSNAGNWKLV